MDEKVKEQQDVLLVKTKQDDKLKVVAGMDEKGKLKTVSPRKEHEMDFMKIDKHSGKFTRCCPPPFTLKCPPKFTRK